jgi:curved DNA-binding protein
MEFKDYYRIMGVARDATQDEIKRTYRQLARKYHPDVSKDPAAEVRFKELGEAYAVLKDIEKRAAYDQLGSNWKAGQEFRPPPDWNTGFEFSGNGAQGPGAADFSDFFETLYGQGYAGGRRARPDMHARGEDRHARVMIDLEDAYNGATRVITLRTPEVDDHGRVSMRSHQLNVTIPRGVHAGQHIRLVGQGALGIGQGKAGDLYLEVGYNPHAHFRVEQRDVFLDLPLAPWEAALGATITVPTPGAAVDVKIPPNSVAGGRLRLKGRGIPGSTPGDLYIVLQIVLPEAALEADRRFYAAMAEQFKSFRPRKKLGPEHG